MTVISIPDSIALRQRTNWRLVTNSPTSGRGLDGRRQIITRENRYWTCQYLVLDAWGRGASWGEYLAFLDELGGMGNTFDIPVRNINGSSNGSGDLFLFNATKMAFEIGTNNAVVTDSNPRPTLTNAAPVGATILTMNGADALALKVGSQFTYNNSLYRLASNNDGVCKINPPLRDAIPAGHRLNIDDMVVRVRLESDSAVQQAYEFSQIGAPYVLTVEEVFQR